MKRAVLYMRVSTLDQHPETQLYDQIVEEYTDTISAARARRPGLDALMRDARRNRFDVVLVWASDRIARSVRHFLDVLDELNRLNIEFISFREQIDTGGPLGRPPDAICAVRSLWRHRSSLLQMASEHTLHMQKALSQMNLQIHHVLSDITGVSGLAILDAVLVGERDPMRLAQLCHAFVKTPHEIVAKALVGDYRPEHLFTLKQSLDGYRFYKKLITELDQETARLMQAVPSAGKQLAPMPARTKHTVYQRNGNDPRFDLRSELYRIAGVDLTDVPGVSAITAQVILTETGPDVSRFRNASAFASWLGLCPEKRVSGGKVLSCKTRKVKSRAALALRMGANSLCRAKGYFGEFFRRMRAKLGTAQAITATAHKIARILYHVLLSKQPYTESIFRLCDEQAQFRAEKRLRKQAALLGFQVVPIPGMTTNVVD